MHEHFFEETLIKTLNIFVEFRRVKKKEINNLNAEFINQSYRNLLVWKLKSNSKSIGDAKNCFVILSHH